MQRCLVQWVSSGKKPSGHPADRGMACWRDACCSRTETRSFWRPWPPLSWIPMDPRPIVVGSRAPVMPCRAAPCVRSIRSCPPLAWEVHVRSPGRDRSRKYQPMLAISFFLHSQMKNASRIRRDFAKPIQSTRVSSVTTMHVIFNQDTVNCPRHSRQLSLQSGNYFFVFPFNENFPNYSFEKRYSGIPTHVILLKKFSKLSHANFHSFLPFPRVQASSFPRG